VSPGDLIVVIYHGNCHDGFGAAWAAWRALGDRATYIPAQYGQPMPEIPDGAVVAMVDISYPRDQLEELAKRCAELTVLDHHATAREDLEGVPFAIFDMNKSGARLAWEFWHPHEPLPKLLAYVEDRDLWRWELWGSRAVSAALSSYPMLFHVWDYLKDNIDLLISEGESILRFTDVQVEMMCQQVRFLELGGYTVPVVNASAFWSEVGEYLLEKYPDAPFAACYYDRGDGVRHWSLRSRPDFDVSQVARQYGGGGHRQAAGFQEPIPG